MNRRRVLIAVLAFVLFGVGTIAWTLAGLPPVRFILRYGLSPGCEPTGNVETIEGVTFVEIGPGIFRMGSNHLAEGGDWIGKLCEPFGLPWGKRPEPSDEMPVHWVEFRRGYWIAKTEITKAQYARFRPGLLRFKDHPADDNPVTDIDWDTARQYCTWLAEKSGRPTRLPSEAEWECACRAGSAAEFTFGDDEEKLSEYAWFREDRESGARAVATKRPNRWGLFDLHGNVWEWCEDTYHRGYGDAPLDGSPWTNGGVNWRSNLTMRVQRGGCWHRPAENCASALRGGQDPTSCFRDVGFRPAFSNPDD